MTAITIDPTRLKTIRTSRKIGRPKLAKLTGLTERQITKFESASAPQLSAAALHRLAEALQTPAPTLTGEFPLTEDDLTPASATKCTNGCCG